IESRNNHILCFPVLSTDTLLSNDINLILKKCYYDTSILFIDMTRAGIDIFDPVFAKYHDIFIENSNVIFRRINIDLYSNAIIASLVVCLREFPCNDVLFIKPELKVPDMWDVRLKKAAYSDSVIATASPMCDYSPFFSLLDVNSSNDNTNFDFEDIDRLSFCLGHRFVYETPYFFDGCFYLRFDALNEIEDHNLLFSSNSNSTLSDLNNALISIGKLHVLCDHLYVGYDKSISNCVSYNNIDYSKYNFVDKEFLLSHPLTTVRQAVAYFIDKKYKIISMPGLESKPVILHITHSWGGGIEEWIRDFSNVRDKAVNIVLKSIGNSGVYGYRLALFTNIKDTNPIRSWELSLPILCSKASNIEYRRILNQIIKEFSVDAIIISSFIGHSFDVISSNKKTVIVCHDYYPFCPAITTYFDGVCAKCDFDSLSSCIYHNKSNLLMNSPEFSAREWLNLRGEYVRLIKSHGVSLVAPSKSAVERLCALESRFSPLDFTVIPHGYLFNDFSVALDGDRSLRPYPMAHSKMRAIVLGQLKREKGLHLLQEVCHGLSQYVDIYLVGCGEKAKQSLSDARCIKEIIERYDRSDLPGIIKGIAPDFGLLLSVWPETFSYVLSELMILGVPPVATALGSFKDRIIDGVNGFLFEPSGDALLERVRLLSEHPAMLTGVRERLKCFRHRSLDEMVDDYVRLLGIGRPQAARYEPCIGTETGLTEPYMRLYSSYKGLERAYAHMKEAYEQKTEACERMQLRIAELNESLMAAITESENMQKKLEEIYGSLYWKVGRFFKLIGSD
ncbi:MAG: glycosyltransferase, partial [Dissulfurimicrobium sp.]|uniref:glycosyltransferase n=1 Tax=Dissulfurimicrobium sp. TaxID=2022436 RepID=UPI003D0DBDE6